jgi:peptidylprolyl isomerase
MSNPVKDRSGLGLPSKAERRALGKAAAQKRAQQRRRREIRNRVAQVAAPIAVIGVIVAAVWFFSGGDEPTALPAPTTTTAAAPPCTGIPADLQATLGTKPIVTAGEGTLSELKVTTLVEGTGAPVASGETICVNYVGVYYTSGEEFDGSWDAGAAPVEFPIGVGYVIAGWDQGLVGVKVGSRVMLDIPVDLAYQGDPNKPAGDLRFVVDILQSSQA